MSHADEPVDFEHLVATAVQQQAGPPVVDDPLPTPEELARAKASSASGAAHSTSSAQPASSNPVKGLGGAGLNLKRRGGSKGGNGSTISAATAPPMLSGTAAGGGRSSGATRAAAAAACSSSTTSTSPPAAASTGSSDAAAAVGGEGGGGDPAARQMKSGLRSFRTVVTPDEDDDEGVEGSDEGGSSSSGRSSYESADTDEAEALLQQADQSSKPERGMLPRHGKVPEKSKEQHASSSSSSWGQLLDDMFDPTSLAVCGLLLAACAGACVVLGTKAWMNSKR